MVSIKYYIRYLNLEIRQFSLFPCAAFWSIWYVGDVDADDDYAAVVATAEPQFPFIIKLRNERIVFDIRIELVRYLGAREENLFIVFGLLFILRLFLDRSF